MGKSDGVALIERARVIIIVANLQRVARGVITTPLYVQSELL